MASQLDFVVRPAVEGVGGVDGVEGLDVVP
jgi:hypothetical protein